MFVPLSADDPLITLGPDGKPNTGDEVPPGQRFMVLTRAQNQPGADGVLGTSDDIQNANNTDTPWVDQSQTYTSHASHQVFLREYALQRGRASGLDRQAARRPARRPDLPELARRAGRHRHLGRGQEAGRREARPAAHRQGRHQHPDARHRPVRQVHPGPARPAAVRASRTARWSRATSPAPVPVPANVVYFDTPFLTDIAHNADPTAQLHANGAPCGPANTLPDADATPSADFAHQPEGTYDDEMLNAHFVCGDGRCNENIALTTIHQIFHSEHDRLVDYIKDVLENDTSPTGLAALAQWKPGTAAVTPGGWNGERLFQAARFVDRDGVPAPRLRGVRTQGAAGGPAVPRLQPGHQPGHRGRVRPRRLPLRPLDARRRRRPDDDERRRQQDGQLAAAADRVPEPARVLPDGPRQSRPHRSEPVLHAAAGGGRDRHGLVRPGRQRARRVRHRDAAQQPARPAARPADAQHDPRPRGRHPAAQRRAPADLRRDQRRPAGAVHQLDRLRPAPQAPRVADQLRGGLRHAPDDHDSGPTLSAGERRERDRQARQRATRRSSIRPTRSTRHPGRRRRLHVQQRRRLGQ